jgi:hypothetical protein
VISIEQFEVEIIKVLKNDAEAIAAHKEITKSEEKKAALTTLGGLTSVESYQGNIEDLLTDLTGLPAARVLYGGARDENEKAREGARGKVDVMFSVMVVGQNLIGSAEASLDVRRLLAAVRTVLNGLIFRDGTQERTLLWISEALELVSNTGVCAYEQQYQYKDWLTT